MMGNILFGMLKDWSVISQPTYNLAELRDILKNIRQEVVNQTFVSAILVNWYMLRTQCFYLFCLLSTVICVSSHGQKINGVSMVNPPQPIGQSEMSSLHRINADWVAVIPFGFVRNGQSGVYYNGERQWWGERVDGTRTLIELAEQERLNVMLKPHLWMRGGWIGDFELDGEEAWQEWETQYQEFILTYAHLAEELEVPLLCIGTELKKAVVQRPQFWVCLIGEIRKIYHGKLTYAANWDNVENITFWKELDYIGVDAYFVISEASEPKKKDLELGWRPIRETLKTLSQKNQRPILFTEFGYQSAKGSAGKHWEVYNDISNLDLDIQCLAYEVLFETFWSQDFFAGGFLWKWHFKEDAGGVSDTRFTPQGKPAEQLIARFYAK